MHPHRLLLTLSPPVDVGVLAPLPLLYPLDSVSSTDRPGRRTAPPLLALGVLHSSDLNIRLSCCTPGSVPHLPGCLPPAAGTPAGVAALAMAAATAAALLLLLLGPSLLGDPEPGGAVGN